MFNNQTQGPYLNEQALPSHPLGAAKPGKLTRAEKKALKLAKKNGTLIGGEYIAPVAPREELFMGHPTINEIQKPGLASGYGIPEYGRAGSPLGLGGQGSPSRFAGVGSPSRFAGIGSPSRLGQTYQAQSLGGQQYTTGSTYTTSSQQYTSGSPRVIYESAMPATTSYTSSMPIGGTTTCCTEQQYVQQQPTTVIYEQPMQQIQQVPMQQMPMTQQQLPHSHYAQPVQVQGYYDGMMLEQPHEKAGGFFAPFTGSFTNRGHGTTGGLQGQGKANFTNTIASAIPGQNHGGILPSTGGAGNPLLNAPNLTYPVALEGERITGFGSNKHTGLHPPGTKLSRKEKKALKNGTLNNNPEYNNAAIY